MEDSIYQLSKLLEDEPEHEHAAVLSYEAGGVLEDAMYMHWAKQNPDKNIDVSQWLVMKGKLKSNLMDVLAQAWTLALKLGCTPENMLLEGCEKAIEAINQKKSGNLSKHMEEKW